MGIHAALGKHSLQNRSADGDGEDNDRKSLRRIKGRGEEAVCGSEEEAQGAKETDGTVKHAISNTI
jgi:hypothetical protein